MTSNDIQKALASHFRDNSKYIVPNIFYFRMDNDYESDLLIFKENGSVFEIEIKVSRSDFFADFKKGLKHNCLKEGGFITENVRFARDVNKKLNKYLKGDFVPTPIPNRFYFAVPDDLIKVDELPDYCGLFYVSQNGFVRKIKESKILTKEKIINYEKLTNKFYWAWMTSKKKIEYL